MKFKKKMKEFRGKKKLYQSKEIKQKLKNIIKKRNLRPMKTLWPGFMSKNKRIYKIK